MFRKVDLHGYTVEEARTVITRAISNMTEGELKVIHGFSSPVLQSFVRQRYRNKRIEKKILTMNPGETIFVIKKKEGKSK